MQCPNLCKCPMGWAVGSLRKQQVQKGQRSLLWLWHRGGPCEHLCWVTQSLKFRVHVIFDNIKGIISDGRSRQNHLQFGSYTQNIMLSLIVNVMQNFSLIFSFNILKMLSSKATIHEAWYFQELHQDTRCLWILKKDVYSCTFVKLQLENSKIKLINKYSYTYSVRECFPQWITILNHNQIFLIEYSFVMV